MLFNFTYSITKNEMATPKKLGIWMDHTFANLIEFTSDPIETTVLESKFTHEIKEQALHKGENRMHNKEQHQQAEYYKKLGDIIRNYKEVLLFGPTDAKTELFNSLISNHHFDKVKIDVKQSDKMTENQQHAFVKDYFAKHITSMTNGNLL
jgi:Lhr-like helicase